MGRCSNRRGAPLVFAAVVTLILAAACGGDPDQVSDGGERPGDEMASAPELLWHTPESPFATIEGIGADEERVYVFSYAEPEEQRTPGHVPDRSPGTVVTAMALDDGEQVWAHPLEGGPDAFVVRGAVVVVATIDGDGGARAAVLDSATGAVLHEFATPDQDAGYHLAPVGGKVVLISERLTGRVDAVSTTDGRLAWTLEPAGVIGPSLDAEPAAALLRTQEGVALVDAASGGLTPIAVSDQLWGAVVGPDGEIFTLTLEPHPDAEDDDITAVVRSVEHDGTALWSVEHGAFGFARSRSLAGIHAGHLLLDNRSDEVADVISVDDGTVRRRVPAPGSLRSVATVDDDLILLVHDHGFLVFDPTSNATALQGAGGPVAVASGLVVYVDLDDLVGWDIEEQREVWRTNWRSALPSVGDDGGPNQIVFAGDRTIVQFGFEVAVFGGGRVER